MTRKNWCIRLSVLAFASLVLTYTFAVSAQSTPSSYSTFRNRLRRASPIKYRLPPKGAPGQRTDAGSRSVCSPLNGRLVALVPPTNIGFTVATSPTFWFYIPYKPNSRAFGKFQLLDEEDNVIYATYVLSNVQEITNIDLPRNVALEVGKQYRWVLSFSCDSSTQASVFVHGYVERVAVAPSLEQELNMATTQRERIAIYGESGLWFDMLTALITEIRNQPEDTQLKRDWQDLLQSPEVNLYQLVKVKEENCKVAEVYHGASTSMYPCR